MAQELERPHVTEMHVRMDCNGCVHRIKRALHGIEGGNHLNVTVLKHGSSSSPLSYDGVVFDAGIYNVSVDLPHQKLTVVGRASPEKMVKAIKKTRKIATVRSHTEAASPGTPEPPPAEPAAAGGDPPAPADQPPAEAPPAEATPPTEQTKETPATPEEAREVKPTPEAAEAATSQPEGKPEGKDVGEVHMIHHYPQHHLVYRDHWAEQLPYGYPVHYDAAYNVVHSDSIYRASANISEYAYLRPTPHSTRYTAEEAYSDGYYRSSGGSEGNNITSIFSDENPNACTIA